MTPEICLALTIYYEARGEPEIGQYAVAEVVLNRVESPSFQDDVCSVVKHPYQFSFYWDGLPEDPKNERAYRKAKRIASDVLSPTYTNNHVCQATHYVTRRTFREWMRGMTVVRWIGNHVFLTTGGGLCQHNQ